MSSALRHLGIWSPLGAAHGAPRFVLADLVRDLERSGEHSSCFRTKLKVLRRETKLLSFIFVWSLSLLGGYHPSCQIFSFL